MKELPRRGPFAGRLNLLDGAVVAAAAGLVRTGEVISLNLELAQPWLDFRPQPVRSARLHNQIRPLDNQNEHFYLVNDDDLSFALQGSSHLDAFAHFGLIEGDSDAVYFGGVGLEETFPQPEAPRLGIHAFQPGIVTRGLLLDLVDHIGYNNPGYLPLDRHVTGDEVSSLLVRLELELRRLSEWLNSTGRIVEDQFARRGPRATRPADTPLSTSPMDGFINPIRASIQPRAYGLKNRQRTNRLLLLMQLHANRQDDERAYVRHIRDCLEANQGRPTIARRAIIDAGDDASLR